MTSLRGARWVWLSLAVVAADRVSKIILDRVTEPGYLRPVIPGFLNLVHARNRGVAFSMFADSDSGWLRVGLILFSLAAVALLGWLLTTGRAGAGAMRWGCALVVAGAAGNVIDRILYGSVLDFLDFYVREWHWPAFNVADSAITIGAVLILWEMTFGARASGEAAAASEKS
ncbi:MAG TPA: signal peptidase II [Candidatus Acidoferrales bacterium]|jgi:signal peptidase II|nr:signal peptidase II [Candidatus Acidoferrales bacterium]